MFVDFGEEHDKTRILVAFTAFSAWALMGISAMDVVLNDASPPVSETVWPMVILGVMLAIVCAMFGFVFLARAVGREAGATEAGGLLND
jgi:TRAP-type C4-dicarboxylate transport system permease small subunit